MPTDSSLHWKEISLQAMDESNGETLLRLVPEAEAATFRRREELENSPDEAHEVSTMAVATEALRAIRSQQLIGD